MPFVWGMVGLVVFAIAGMIGGAGSGGVFFGMVTGAVLGVLWGRQAKLRGELVQVRALLERSLTRQAAA